MTPINYRIKDREEFLTLTDLPVEKVREIIHERLGENTLEADGYYHFAHFPQMRAYEIRILVQEFGNRTQLVTELQLVPRLLNFNRIFPFLLGGIILVMFLMMFIKSFTPLFFCMMLLMLLTGVYGILIYITKIELHDCRRTIDVTLNMYEKIVGGGPISLPKPVVEEKPKIPFMEDPLKKK